MASLTDDMRAATRPAHTVSTGLVSVKLLIALTSNALYGRSLLLFYFVYADNIAKDLKFYLGEDWSDKHKPTAAAEAYVKHLKELEKTNPTLLLAYFYHMYTALLVGGQMMRKFVKKSFEPPAGEGLNIFDFGSKSKMALRSALKDTVNAVECDAATRQQLLAESLKCFEMNNQIVRSIDGAVRQLASWVLKWVVALFLVYLTYVTFVRGT
ncbi:hypothetical protein PybrP1_001243 [[Pythium] brassicae (nom. inval.)]|nr:hypothetical protein PybrP1_001243 [[Pythium] brassicae (nom. inval.)]